MSPLTFKVYRKDELLSVETFEREIIKIGRLSSAHLRLDDEKVSRIHAVIEVSAGGETNIIDMGSAEGTFVNGQKINKISLNPGDEIRLGNIRLVFQDGAPLNQAVPAAEQTAPAGATEPAQAAVSEPAASGLQQVSDVQDEPVLLEKKVSARSPDLSQAQAASDLIKSDNESAAADAPPMQGLSFSEFDQQAQAPQASPPYTDVASGQAEAGYAERVALPPPSELGELDDDETVTSNNWRLEVRKLWGNTVLDVRTFGAEDKEVWVGEDKSRAHFYLPAEVLPQPSFPVAQLVGQDVMLTFASNTKGEVVSKDGSVTDLMTLANSSKAAQDPKVPGCRTFRLENGAVATLHFGGVGLRFRCVSPPAGYFTKFTENLDYTYLNTLLLMFFAFGAMVATFHLRPRSVETSEEELYKVPDRFVQFILTRPEQTEKNYAKLAKLRDKGTKKEASGARHKGKEGKMGLKGKPDTGRRSAVRAIKPDDKEVVGNRGLLAVLGSGGPQGLSTVMGGTGLGGELEGAIGNLGGPTVGDSGGFGGLGLKGTGTGGGGMGNTIGVGRLGTSGRGGGRSGYGTGVSRIRRRSERNINISVGKPVIMGSLSMEIIRRVIHSHRDQIKYCYSKELTRNPNLSGKVSIRFTINPKGYVQQAVVGQTTLRNASVERCMAQKIRTWKFPEPKGGGIVIVNYPFILNPS